MHQCWKGAIFSQYIIIININKKINTDYTSQWGGGGVNPEMVEFLI